MSDAHSVLWIALLALVGAVALGIFAFGSPTRSAGRAAGGPPLARRAAREPDIEEETDREFGGSALQVQPSPELTHDEPTSSFDWFASEDVARSDPGKRRRTNEDRFLCMPECGLFVVADGMGGETSGEVASTLAVEEMKKALTGPPASERGYEADVELPRASEWLVDAIARANRAIRRRIVEQPELRGMGTTIVAMMIVPRKNRIYVAHVGDSRAYRIHGGDIQRLTDDHTLARIADVPGNRGERLAWALGVEEGITVDATSVAPQVGDCFLLCSDGLTKLVSDREIAEIVGGAGSLEARADRLIALANERGGTDNITVVIVQVHNIAKLRDMSS